MGFGILEKGLIKMKQFLCMFGLMLAATAGQVHGAISSGVLTTPPNAPDWWGSTDGLTNSIYFNYDTPDTTADAYVIADQLAGIPLDSVFTNASWTDDPLGKGFIASGQAFQTIQVPNDYVATNVKRFFYAAVIIGLEHGDYTLDSLTGNWGGNPSGNVTNIKFARLYVGKNRWVINVWATITPQPQSETIVVTWTGNSPPIVSESWAGTKCSPVPEPSMMVIATVFGIGGYIGKRRMKK